MFPDENDIIMGLMRAVGLSTCDFRLIKMGNDRGIAGVCRTTIGRRILQKEVDCERGWLTANMGVKWKKGVKWAIIPMKYLENGENEWKMVKMGVKWCK